MTDQMDNRGHYDILYQPQPIVNIAPVTVNYQYAMTSNYLPWDQGFSFDVNPHLMAIPGLAMDPSYTLGQSPIAPASPGPSYSTPSTADMYQQQPSPIYSPTTTAPVTAPQFPLPQSHSQLSSPSSPPSNRSSEGAQIRLNPLVMKSNLSRRSMPSVTSPKKYDISLPPFLLILFFHIYIYTR